MSSDVDIKTLFVAIEIHLGFCRFLFSICRIVICCGHIKTSSTGETSCIATWKLELQNDIHSDTVNHIILILTIASRSRNVQRLI
jgi:hypothetical protein